MHVPAGTSQRLACDASRVEMRHDAEGHVLHVGHPGGPRARRERVRVQLNDVAQAFPPGHRIRVAISTAYWPLAWPPPEPVTLTVFTGASTLELPVRSAAPEDRRRAASLRSRQRGTPGRCAG